MKSSTANVRRRRRQLLVRLLIVAQWVVLGSAHLARADDARVAEFKYHPNLDFRLGDTFDLEQGRRTSSSCVEGVTSSVEPGAQGSAVTADVVTNYDELREALKIDAAVEAAFPVWSASISADYQATRFVSQTAASIVFTAISEYNPLTLGSPRLTERAKAALASDPLRFRQMCGTHFVKRQKRGSRIAFVLTLVGLSESERESLKLAVAARYGRVSGSASFSRTVERIKKEGRLQTAILSNGGGGIADIAADLSGVVQRTDLTLEQLLDSVRKTLEAAVRTYRAENAGGNGAVLEPLSFLDESISQPNLMSENKRRWLLALVDEYRLVDAYRDAGVAMIDGRFETATGAPPPEPNLYRQTVERLDEHLQLLASRHAQCVPTDKYELCRVPERPAVPAELVSYSSAPTLEFVVTADEVRLSRRHGWASLRPYSEPLLARVRRFRPDAQRAAVHVEARGAFLELAWVVWEEESSEEIRERTRTTVGSFRLDSRGGLYRLQSTDGRSTVMDEFIEKLRSVEVARTKPGTLRLVLQDALGRSSEYVVAQTAPHGSVGLAVEWGDESVDVLRQ